MKKKHILLLMKNYSHSFHLGVVKYAGQHFFSVHHLSDFNSLQRYNKYDGIITFYISDQKLIEKLSGKSKIPIVHFGNRRASHSSVFLQPDDKAIGQKCGEYFVGRGFMHIGFYMSKKDHYLSNRINSFRSIVENSNRIFHIASNDNIATLLQNIPKPAAFMAANDSHALNLIEICRDNNIKVPEEIAILGAGNNTLLCSSAPIPISSLDTGHENWGYESIRWLDKLIAGEVVSKTTIKMPPGEIITRQSTDIMAIQHEKVLNALQLLNSKFKDSCLVPEDISEALGISRRRLDNVLKRDTGYTLHERLLKLRAAEAMRLQKQGDMKGYEIAEKSGFSSYLQMHRTLRSRKE